MNLLVSDIGSLLEETMLTVQEKMLIELLNLVAMKFKKCTFGSVQYVKTAISKTGIQSCKTSEK